MPPFSAHRFTRLSFALLLLALSLPSSGCIAAAVTAGVVGAGATGYFYWQGAVAQEYPAGMDQTLAVTRQVLAELQMPVDTDKHDKDVATIESHTGDGTKVQITLEPRPSNIPADGPKTRVSIRVGVFGDSHINERFFNQLDAHLGAPPQPGRLVPVPQTQPPPGINQTGPPPLAAH